MTLDEAKEYFVTWANMMRKLGLARSTWTHWKTWGYIPYHQQKKIEEISEGKLQANINDKRKRGNDDEILKKARDIRNANRTRETKR